MRLTKRQRELTFNYGEYHLTVFGPIMEYVVVCMADYLITIGLNIKKSQPCICHDGCVTDNVSMGERVTLFLDKKRIQYLATTQLTA